RKPLCGTTCAKFRHKFYSRAGVERRSFGDGGNGAGLSARSEFLRGESCGIFLQRGLRGATGSGIGNQLHGGVCEQRQFFAECATTGILCARFLAGDETSDRELRTAL